MVLQLLRKRRVLVLTAIVLASVYFATYMLHSPFVKASYIFNQAQSVNGETKFIFQHRNDLPIPQFNPSASLNNANGSNIRNDTAVSSGYGSCSLVKGSSGVYFKQEQYVYFTEQFKLSRDPVAAWFRDAGIRSVCDDKFAVYDNRFASVHNALLRPSQIVNLEKQAKGGEEVRHVLRQGLDKEDYKFSSGFLELNCTGANQNAGTFKWLRSVTFKTVADLKQENVTDMSKSSTFDYESRFTVAIVRIDYANLHNWAREVYNAILIMMHFNVQPKDAVVLFLDGHPFTNLDNTWQNIFGTVKRVGHLNKPVYFRHLVLGFEEGDGLVSNFRMKDSAYLEECRAFILQQHNLNPQSTLKCPTPTITLLIRRNAVFHPRNVEGKVGRKIYNEAQIIDALMTAFPGACIQGVLMESLPVKSQLQIMSQTDLLIGMHGAGMTHSLFLPQPAAILELFAKDFKKGRPWFECYQSIARWRGLKYDSWENFDSAAEMPFDFTIVPIDIIVDKAKQLMNQLCVNRNT